MSFLQRNRKFLNRDDKKSILIPFFTIIFFIFIFSLSYTRNILFTVGSPLWYIKNSTVNFMSDNISVLRSKTSLVEENTQLKDQLLIKNKEQALFEILKKENEDLKNILNRKKSSQKLLLSSVLIKPFLSAYDTLIIDAGKSAGVEVGDQVLAEGNIFIGYVSDVHDDVSKVVLYSSSGEKVKVLIGNSNIEKEAIGLGGGNFRMELPREIDIKEGDNVVMPSISPNIFGTVEKIEFKESDSFQYILFKNPVNISELKWVEVILANK